MNNILSARHFNYYIAEKAKKMCLLAYEIGFTVLLYV